MLGIELNGLNGNINCSKFIIFSKRITIDNDFGITTLKNSQFII